MVNMEAAMNFGSVCRLLPVIALATALGMPAFAQSSAGNDPDTAWANALKVAIKGPADVPLSDQGTLKLPAGDLFFPKEAALDVMSSWGNSRSSNLIGMVVPESKDSYWAETVEFISEGYIKDDDAKDWDAEELLQSIKDGTEEQNAERIKNGMPALDIVGWIERPTYDAATHRLIWSIKGVDRGAPVEQEATVNYNTYVLGREGYFQLDLLTTDKQVEKDKSAALAVLANLNFNAGKRYEDFNESTDHIAEYGIAALIGGVVAKKLGLLAIAGLFIAKFFKIILVGLAVAGGAFAKLFRKKTSET
jgi:uncharacterized membrane-anchored protein